MKNISFTLVLICVFSCFNANAQTNSYKEQKQQYFEACSTLNRSNIDCQCVARNHATYAHLSPNLEYAEYLIEAYKERLGLPNRKLETFEAYYGSRSEDEASIEVHFAFEKYDSADPFDDEVKGCVIPNAPRVKLAPLPSERAYQEMYNYSAQSTGSKRFEQCRVVELKKVLSPQETAALLYVYYRSVGDEALIDRFKQAPEVVKSRAEKANKKYKDHEKTARNMTNYCLSMLAAEEQSTGNIIERYLASEEERKQLPDALVTIDITKPRPPVTNTMASEVQKMQQEAEKIRQETLQYGSAEEVIADFKQSEEYQTAEAVKNTEAKTANRSFLDKGCASAGRSEAFCECFTSNILNALGDNAGGAALPIIADGISDKQAMAIMKSIDMSTYMQDVMKAQSISDKCESE